MRVMGVDPDLRYCAFSVVSGDSLETSIFEAPRREVQAMIEVLAEKLSGLLDIYQPDLVVIEGQQIYLKGGKARPDDILKLAQVAGACAALCAAHYCKPKIIIPKPGLWKGQVPKIIHQRRLCEKHGIEHTDWPKKHRSHAIDSAGLAYWGLDRC